MTEKSTKIGVSFLAESASSTETKIIFGQSGVIISVFNCFIGIDFVGESHKPIVITMHRKIVLVFLSRTVFVSYQIPSFSEM